MNTQEDMDRTYRPHCPQKDYHERGIYLITLVVNVPGTTLSELNMDMKDPGVVLTDIGESIAQEWEKTVDIQKRKGNHVRILGKVVMPNHFHGLIYVEERLKKGSLGDIIKGFKGACTSAYWRTYLSLTQHFNSVSADGKECPPLNSVSADGKECLPLNSVLPQSRDALPPSLFIEGYDDSILWRKGQLQSMIDYVHDNPRRAIIRKLYPDFYERRLHIWIDGTDENGCPTKREYAAFGNLFLLRYPWKEQVMCHRWKMNGMCRDYDTPYVNTEEYRHQHDELIHAAEEGAVLVTPGISKGEQNIKKDAFAKGLRLIHLQKEPIGPKWKPENERFYACKDGKLLILAPWGIEQMADRELCLDGHTANIVPADTSYSQFHNMNDLAAEICRGITKAKMDIV